MKALIAGAFAALMLSASASAADHLVSGYTRSNGTYVAPHYQTNPNYTTSDNYSTRGNVNPYTGQMGTKPDTRPSYGSTYTPPSYSAPSYTTPSYGSTYTPPSYGTQLGGTQTKRSCTNIYGC